MFVLFSGSPGDINVQPRLRTTGIDPLKYEILIMVLSSGRLKEEKGKCEKLGETGSRLPPRRRNQLREHVKVPSLPLGS